MFVEIDMDNLPVHALVQLLLPIRGRSSEPYLRIPAAVSRYAQEGLALVYCGNYAPLLKYVRAWSRHKKHKKKGKPKTASDADASCGDDGSGV
jgi:ribosomal protein S16